MDNWCNDVGQNLDNAMELKLETKAHLRAAIEAMCIIFMSNEIYNFMNLVVSKSFGLVWKY